MVEATDNQAYKVQFVEQDSYSPRKVARLRHTYSEHPLLSIPALAQLAERLYKKNTGQVKFLSKGTKLDSDFNTLTQSQDEKSISDVFENITNPGSWIALYAVQTEPEYKKLVWDIVNSVEGNWKKLDPDVYFVDGYIFISSPPSVTPYHIDRENNFLLQVAGKKRFGVWNPTERNVLSEEAIEDWITYSYLTKVKYQPEFLKYAAVNDVLQPGEGIYMPSTAPHMTHAEADLATVDSPYSITIGVVFYTRNTRRLAYIYAVNRMLRKLGFAPKSPETNKLLDQLKYIIGRVMVLSQRALRMYSPPTGF